MLFTADDPQVCRVGGHCARQELVMWEGGV